MWHKRINQEARRGRSGLFGEAEINRPEQLNPARGGVKALNFSEAKYVRAWLRFVHTLKSSGFGARLAGAVAFLALVSSVATVAALSRKSGPLQLDTGTVRVLLVVNVVLLLVLAALILRRLIRMWVERKTGLGSSRLHSRIVGYFSLIAVVPPIIMIGFSAWFFGFGLENWFSEKVRSTLNDSLEVAEAYIDEHRRVVQADLVAMAIDINRQSAVVAQNSNLLQLLVDDQVSKRALSEAIVFDGVGTVLAQSRFDLARAPDGVPGQIVDRARQGELVIISETADDRVRGVIQLEQYVDTFLYVSRLVDARVLAHVQSARDSVAEYRTLQGESTNIQISFNLIFLIIGLLVLFAAAWIGLWFATQMVTPLGRLVDAVDRVGKGDFKARVPLIAGDDEIGILSRAFNRMIRQIHSQHKDLVSTNIELDQRHRFTEAVLAGVSAAVIGIDEAGLITLPNPVACEALGHTADELIGQPLLSFVPEFEEVLANPLEDEDIRQRQVEIDDDGLVRTVLVRLSAERQDGVVKGYVVTFDDISEQLANQRTAAWADVARRIAHEIKNPLTPIQLAAERLWRKYGDEVSSDPEVFKNCTDTIIRQVNDLRQMVDEFSSFARMPAPVLHVEDLKDIIRQVLFLQEVASPDIVFELSLPEGGQSLVCDRRQVAQALTNLVKNATESIHARQSIGTDGQKAEDGKISIRVESADHRITVSISDNGMGLPQEMIDRLTEPYVTTREKGTGLGLAIVKKIMEDHGGSLQIENRGNAGAEARLVFDCKELNERIATANDAEASVRAPVAKSTKSPVLEGVGDGT